MAVFVHPVDFDSVTRSEECVVEAASCYHLAEESNLKRSIIILIDSYRTLLLDNNTVLIYVFVKYVYPVASFFWQDLGPFGEIVIKRQLVSVDALPALRLTDRGLVPFVFEPEKK